MKTIMVMFNSLNRRMLSPYGCDWVMSPNFQRLADRAVTFDCSYVGSMPCMLALQEPFEHTTGRRLMKENDAPAEQWVSLGLQASSR